MRRIVGVLLGSLAAILCNGAALGATDGSVTVGTQWWDQTANEAKFQEFRVEHRGAFLEDYVLRSWKGRNFARLYGEHSLRHDQTTSLTWWNGARVRLDLGYQELPHNISFIAHSPFSEIAPCVERIPDSLQAANQANPAGYVARLKDALNASPRLNMGFRTDITTARLKA